MNKVKINDLVIGSEVSFDGGMNFYTLHAIDVENKVADWGNMDGWKIAGKFAIVK